MGSRANFWRQWKKTTGSAAGRDYEAKSPAFIDAGSGRRDGSLQNSGRAGIRFDNIEPIFGRSKSYKIPIRARGPSFDGAAILRYH